MHLDVIGGCAHGRGYRQKMTVIEAVWPVTALYFGPLAWWGYQRWGRLSSPASPARDPRRN